MRQVGDTILKYFAIVINTLEWKILVMKMVLTNEEMTNFKNQRDLAFFFFWKAISSWISFF